ncbi:alpha/beta hydrolase [Mycolicibacterium komossense]|uniref:Alpha/beta hydrolase n=1 Tax=Mycolicibacterium komossense TaxID=1779 RepID=A0ABT3CCY8_9MYCO|nr:alpha/beta hydrolase [Mycolicibacterium komossense]MCV7227312.1 alpha/beta hydrolase [Mycolicibacterium komossense]
MTAFPSRPTPTRLPTVQTGPEPRGSVRSRITAEISARTLRQISAVLPPERAWGLWASRQIVANIMNTFGPRMAGTVVEPVDETLPDGRRVVGEWVRAAGVAGVGDTGSAIYFLHGSGYALCSPRTHRRLTSWLSALTALPVFCIDYRLAPRHRFPTAADDTHAGWDWLRTVCALPPQRIVVAGDSAGGHLAVDLLLHNPTTPRPAALVLFSPLIDLTFTLARDQEQLRRDPAIRAADAARLVQLYCGDADPTHPRLTHLLAAAATPLPRTLIQAGGAEMLVADARHLAASINAGGGECELQIWPDQVHVFQALPRLTPEAAAAMRHAAGFITDSLEATRCSE